MSLFASLSRAGCGWGVQEKVARVGITRDASEGLIRLFQELHYASLTPISKPRTMVVDPETPTILSEPPFSLWWTSYPPSQGAPERTVCSRTLWTRHEGKASGRFYGNGNKLESSTHFANH